MNLINIYAIYTGGDDRYKGNPTIFCTDKDIAYDKAKGIGWFGGTADVEFRQAILFEHKYYLIDKIGEIDVDNKQKIKVETLRKNAKAKLTPEEIKALGI